jgi:tripartite ATP-independent transporter DctM subunit
MNMSGNGKSLTSRVVLGICAVALLAFIVWFAMNRDEMSEALMVTIILIGGMFGLMGIGVSVAVSIGLPSAIALVLIMPDAERGLYASAQKIFDGIDNFNLLCIPLFVLAGAIMNQGGIAARLINLAKALTGRMPGALMHTNILANMMFGAISGSALAGASAVGSVMSPAEKEDGYDMNWAAAANIASAPSGMLIPPSNTTVVYAMVSQASVGALFLAGYIPGFLWGVTCMLIVWWYARQHKELRGRGYPPLKEFLLVVWQALPSLLLVIIVMVGIVWGYFTPTEGSGIAVAYALLLSFIYRTIKVRDLPRILMSATRTSSVVIFLIGLSTIMSFAMTFADIPELIANWMIEITGGNKIAFLMLMMVILLVIGIPLDATPAVLIFTPIFLPIAQADPFFIHPVHFGMMMVFNMCIAVISPPSAPVLFVGARVAGKKVEEVMMPLMPFFIALIFTLILIQFVPELSMWIPDQLGMVPDWAGWPK